MYLNKSKTWLLAGFSALCMLYACNDDEYKTGLEIHPKNEIINVGHDSSQNIMAYTYESENKIFASTGQTSYMLGYCNDPYLGSFQNDVITNISFSELTESFIDSAESLSILSVKLYLDFDISDGDTTNLQSISIYELNPSVEVVDLNGVDLYEETLYDYYDANNPLYTFDLQPRKEWPDSNSIVEIELPIEFAERLLTDTIFQGTDTLLPYKNDSVFSAEILSGFYLKSNPNQESQSISTLIMNDSTRLEVSYIKVYNDTLTDTINYRYNIESSYKANLYFNEITDDIAYNKMYTDIEMAVSDTVVFLKNNNGTFTQIVIDGIGDWEDSTNTLINKASVFVEFNEVYDSTTIFNPITSVNVYREIGSELYALANHQDASGNISPISSRTTNFGYGFEIVLTQEVQDLYRDELWDEPIYLILRSASNSASPYRVILNSSTNSDPMKLMITYSKY